MINIKKDAEQLARMFNLVEVDSPNYIGLHAETISNLNCYNE